VPADAGAPWWGICGDRLVRVTPRIEVGDEWTDVQAPGCTALMRIEGLRRGRLRKVELRGPVEWRGRALRVVWAGDLDRDGELDVVAEEAGEEGGDLLLLLTAGRRPGERWRVAAVHHGSGC
jgi:hypothetical protein